MIDVLYRELARHLNGSTVKSGAHKEITGMDWLDKIVDVDQSPIGRTPRSNPATYMGIFDEIRKNPDAQKVKKEKKPVKYEDARKTVILTSKGKYTRARKLTRAERKANVEKKAALMKKQLKGGK